MAAFTSAVKQFPSYFIVAFSGGAEIDPVCNTGDSFLIPS